MEMMTNVREYLLDFYLNEKIANQMVQLLHV
jgi:hypothetical protein